MDFTDEHRIGLKPLIHRMWAPIGQRPIAVVEHRFRWRSLVGFVHPASGRTVWHLASGVSIPLFEAELGAFARAVGASPRKQLVLVLDQAGWHTSERLRVPSLPRTRSPAVPAAVRARAAAGRTALAADQRGAHQCALRRPRRLGRRPARPLCRAPTASRTHPFNNTVPLVAQAYQETPGTQAELVSGRTRVEQDVEEPQRSLH